MKKILLVGTSFSAAPLAECLIKMGYSLHTCGNQAQDPCVSWAGEHHCFDYSNPDLLLELVKKENYSAILPTCNDDSYLSVIKVAEILGLPGFDSVETTLILHDKFKFRSFASSHSIPVPKIWDYGSGSETPNASDYPLLVKPVDSFSGKGITKLLNKDGLHEAIHIAKLHSRSKSYVIESFLNGSLHSHSAFIKKTKIEREFFVDEFCTVYPYQVNSSNCPSSLDNQVRILIRQYIENLSTLLGLADGLLHTQFIVSDGKPYLVECMRRCPGDLFYHLVSFSTENAYISNYLRPFLGKPYVFLSDDKQIPWARHTISMPDDAVVYGYSVEGGAEETRFFQLSESGSLIKKAPYGKVAIFLTRYQSLEQLYTNTKILANKVSLYTNRSSLL
ncbi:ATP-grasp domain-containing protein [Polynucleobacter sp. AP-Capit-er-40B-B4]|uniref:ATP-grasp domain-containing protein n=1 Tax=Polynucleobacter sp. AP-Capit-er-40B-B4 TaxID=2576927 RepID=UPI001C0A9B10|nr:ATP-grasp domain-containing protein [Polynucleobacter sp. AP-Capit-er-40B-B4]MBU3580982.1 ATP-grasp domain-containing protein [Polynucleobacter sp. AP-Capit-er-40B-B4]